MDEPLPPGDVLAQPTRRRLFELLGELRRPATTEELAGALDLHVNGVRRQLERLREARLVEREKAGGGPGRPRHEWSIAPGAEPGGERPRAYSDLARWLARATEADPAGLRRVEGVGRDIGRELAPEGAGDPPESLLRALAALGFRPAVEEEGVGVLRARFCNCPYRDSVRQSPEVVCTLHRGLTLGLLDALAPGAELETFQPHDPDRAGCLLEVTGGSWEPAGTT